MFYNNPIYNFLLERKSSTEISFIPESLWVGDPDNGKKIVDGFMNFNGESIVFDKQTWKKNKGSRSWNEELFCFDWIKDVKGPKAKIEKAINTSADILNRIPDLPNFMDRANYALQLIAEGKLNIGFKNNKSLEIEEMKLKGFRNNILISFLAIVIVSLLVF